MNKMLKAILLVMLALGLVMAGCSGNSEDTGDPESAEETSQHPWIGKPAPDFQFQDADGQSTSLSDFQGKAVLINFWQVRCVPCRLEMPYIQEIYEEWSGKELVVLAINFGEDPSQVGAFLQTYGFSFPVLLDMRGTIAQMYNVRPIPTTFLIDKDGIIQDMKIGAFQSKTEIEEILSKVLP